MVPLGPPKGGGVEPVLPLLSVEYDPASATVSTMVPKPTEGDAQEGGDKPKRRSGPKSRSSPYKGVTQYRRTGKWEAHVWIPNPRGRGFQRHLGSYHTAEEAARCFDRATIRIRGPDEELNFPLEDYMNDPFMLEHSKTDKFRFLDLLRARFAIVSESPYARRPSQRSSSPASAGTVCFTQEDKYYCVTRGDLEIFSDEGLDKKAGYNCRPHRQRTGPVQSTEKRLKNSETTYVGSSSCSPNHPPAIKTPLAYEQELGILRGCSLFEDVFPLPMGPSNCVLSVEELEPNPDDLLESIKWFTDFSWN